MIMLLLVSDLNDIIPVELFFASNKFRYFIKSYKFYATNDGILELLLLNCMISRPIN